MKDWYHIEDINNIDSPSIVLYEDRLMHNLHTMIAMVDGNLSRLIPHIKTNKMPKVIERMISLGISDFKASTIAEAEMATIEGARSVLIAHQLVGPKLSRFGRLITEYPDTRFTTIIDTISTVEKLQKEGQKANIKIGVYIDINSGMDRSGVKLGTDLEHILKRLPDYTFIDFLGLHIYDGHFREPDFNHRKQNVEDEITPVAILFEELRKAKPSLQMICGGTPAFTSHVLESNRICSPGTCVFWDWGYSEKLLEQEFKYVALVVTRVISKPIEGIVTVDLGHKSVGPENPIDKRVKFLNLKDYELLSQSEEHGVLKVKDWETIKVGDVFYGVPYHICPTINLHDEVSVIKDGKIVGTWDITARKRKITI